MCLPLSVAPGVPPPVCGASSSDLHIFVCALLQMEKQFDRYVSPRGSLPALPCAWGPASHRPCLPPAYRQPLRCLADSPSAMPQCLQGVPLLSPPWCPRYAVTRGRVNWLGTYTEGEDLHCEIKSEFYATSDITQWKFETYITMGAMSLLSLSCLFQVWLACGIHYVDRAARVHVGMGMRNAGLHIGIAAAAKAKPLGRCVPAQYRLGILATGHWCSGVSYQILQFILHSSHVT